MHFFSKVLISAASLPGVWLVANASETAPEAIAVRDVARIATASCRGLPDLRVQTEVRRISDATSPP